MGWISLAVVAGSFGVTAAGVSDVDSTDTALVDFFSGSFSNGIPQAPVTVEVVVVALVDIGVLLTVVVAEVTVVLPASFLCDLVWWISYKQKITAAIECPLGKCNSAINR